LTEPEFSAIVVAVPAKNRAWKSAVKLERAIEATIGILGINVVKKV
jgi:hypothetical protein